MANVIVFVVTIMLIGGFAAGLVLGMAAKKRRNANYDAWLNEVRERSFAPPAGPKTIAPLSRFAVPGGYYTPEMLEKYSMETLERNLQKDMRYKLITEETFRQRRAELWKIKEAQYAEETVITAKAATEGSAAPDLSTGEQAKQLEQLQRHLDSGLITREEYKEKRRALLEQQ